MDYKLFLKKDPNAFCAHYFAHRLNLVLVDTTKSIPLIDHFFGTVKLACVACTSSCSRVDEFVLNQQLLNQQNSMNFASASARTGRHQTREDDSLTATRWNCRLFSKHGLLLLMC